MRRPIVIIPSITYAMRGKEILSKNNIASYITRTVNTTKRYGCGYGLYIPKNLDKAVDILSEHGIKIIKILGKGVVNG